MAERPWWLFVLGDQDGVDWVMSQKRMAFVEHLCSRAAKIRKDDRAFVYQTKKVLKKEGRVTALARIEGDLIPERVKVGTGLYFSCWCPLSFIHVVDPEDGVALGPLVPKLEFVRQKEYWAHYLRSGLVRLPPTDGQLLAERLEGSFPGS